MKSRLSWVPTEPKLCYLDSWPFQKHAILVTEPSCLLRIVNCTCVATSLVQRPLTIRKPITVMTNCPFLHRLGKKADVGQRPGSQRQWRTIEVVFGGWLTLWATSTCNDVCMVMEPTYMTTGSRQRLARLKSRLGIETARRYKSKQNEMKVACNPDDLKFVKRVSICTFLCPGWWSWLGSNGGIPIGAGFAGLVMQVILAGL